MSLLVTRKPPLTKALYFDGVSNYVQIPHSDSLIPQNEMTLIVWAYPFNPSTDAKLAGKSPVGSGYVLGHKSNSLYPEVWDSAGTRYTFTAGTITAYKWSMLAVTWKTGGRFIGYVDAQVVFNGSASGNPIGYTTNPFVIGRAPWQDLFWYNGYIAQVMLYNRALSQSEILHNYRNPNNPVRDGLVLWLDARNVLGNTWYDLSGYDNNGTIYGATQVSLFNPPGGW